MSGLTRERGAGRWRLGSGDGHLGIPVPGGAVRLHLRSGLVGLVGAALTLLLAAVALGIGDYPLSIPEVVDAALTDQGFASTVVREWRLPRVLAAIVFGAALAASGALFQTLTRNPLGSPDIIGFATGAHTGAIVSLTVVGPSFLGETAGALVGGLGTAILVYLLAWRGGVQGFRLIIVGIAVTAVLSAVNTYLLLLARTEVAMVASLWGSGSVSLVDWSDMAPALPLLAVLGVLTAVVVRPLRQLELGDDAAHAHGVPAEATRLSVMAVGVALIALVTAVSGPIAFIALAAPQIARRLARSPGVPVGVAAVAGAFLLLAADVVAQHVIPGSVPVGVVTVVIGGVYLVALLVQEARRQL